MFVITLNYKKSLSDVARLVDEHRAFLEHHYISGYFLLSGRKEPRAGAQNFTSLSAFETIEQVRDPP